MIALALIARNEASVIERCIRSCEGIVGSVVLCDTGSTDDTIGRARQTCDELSLPLTVREVPWVSFGHNRSELIETCQGTVALAGDYLLLLDADMTVEGTAESLTADQYLLRIPGDPDYRLPLLVRAGHPWRYQGATHEYLTSDERFTSERLDTLIVHHHCDGARRPEKLQSDKRLLERELNDRTVFYLAQTYRDVGDTQPAIAMYQQRVRMGGWDEERFYAAWQAAKLDNNLSGLLEAWESRPTRLEPLYDAVMLLREHGQHRSAYALAGAGIGREIPSDVLFVHREAWEWGLAFEASISAYWAGDHNGSRVLCDQLLDSPTTPPKIGEAVLRNRAYVCGPLAIPKVFHRVWLGEEMPETFRAYGETWLEHHPDWTMCLWTDEHLPPLRNQEAFDSAPNAAQKTDIVRYEALHRYGGIYLDTDFECLQNIEPLIGDLELFAAREDDDWIAAGFIGAIPGHPFLERLIAELPDAIASEPTQSEQSGPVFLTRRAEPSLRVFGRDLFYPYRYDEKPSGSYPDAYAVHHWAASWF